MNLSEYYNTVMELSHGIVITLDEGGGSSMAIPASRRSPALRSA
jgi:hypothetical protein